VIGSEIVDGVRTIYFGDDICAQAGGDIRQSDAYAAEAGGSVENVAGDDGSGYDG